MSYQNSSVYKSCFLTIRDLRRIRNTLDYTIAQTIDTSLIHSKVDYCNTFNCFSTCLALNLIVFSWFLILLLVLFLYITPKFTHISPVLKSLHWLKIDQRIHYKVLSTTYKTLQSHEPFYLHNLLHVQSNTATRSSATVTLKRPTIHSRLKITDRSFTHYAPVLWNRLPKEFRQPAIHFPHTNQSDSTTTLLALSSSQFHSKLKTHVFRQ